MTLIPDNQPVADDDAHEPREADDRDDAVDDFVREAEGAYDAEAATRAESDDDHPDESDDLDQSDELDVLDESDAGESATDDEAEQIDSELAAEVAAGLQENLRGFANVVPDEQQTPATQRYRLVRTVEIDLDPPLTQPLTMGLGEEQTLLVLDRPRNDCFRIIRVPFAGGRGQSIIELVDGSADNALLDPVGLATDQQGRMYIPDAEENCVKVFSPDGRWLETITTAGEQGAAFDHPRDVDVAEDGHLYIADAYNNRIVKLTADGELVWEFESFSHPQSGDEDELYEPASVCIAGESLAIADTNQNRIVIIDHDAHLKSVLESDGAFEFPSEVRIADDGTLYVADHSNLRVQRFAPDGTLNGLIDLRDDEDSAAGGGDIDIDDNGNVVMIDPVREAVVVLGFVDPE